MTQDLKKYNKEKAAKAKKERILKLTNWLTTDYVLRLGHIKRR